MLNLGYTKINVNLGHIKINVKLKFVFARKNVCLPPIPQTVVKGKKSI